MGAATLNNDKDFIPYLDVFKNTNGVRVGIPTQFTMGPEHFHGEFLLRYQISKEDEKGELFDFRVFYCDVNGLIVKKWINQFNQFFCAKVLDNIRDRSPKLSVSQFEAAPPLRNQLDFLILGIPGRFIEEVLDRYFKLLKARV